MQFSATPEQGHPFEQDLNWLLHRVGASLGSAQDEIARRHGLGGIRSYVVLRTIAESNGWVQLALGKALGLDKSALTIVLDRLDEAGLITRRPVPGDRRARLCETTDKGSKLARSVAEEVAETEQQLLADLSPGDRATLVGLLRQLASGPFADSAPISGSCI